MEQLRQSPPDWEPVAATTDSDAPRVEEREAEGVAPEWGLAKRIVFRFLFSYLLLYNFPFPLDVVPTWSQLVLQPYTDLWNVLVPWVGKHVLGVEVLHRPGGSGDTTYNYVQLLCYVVIALAATAVWTLLDRKRKSYARLDDWLRLYVRFVLVSAMIGYGMSKLIPVQMIEPWPSKLLQPIGDGSPMGLVWTFIGASVPYTMFSGAAELLAGFLLVARRTALFGALVCTGVMANVVMLNFSYDVPVKLFSSHLLLMAVFLVLPDLKRIANLLMLNRPAPTAGLRPLLAGRRARRAALVFQTAFVLLLTGTALYQAYDALVQYGDSAPKPKLYGIWEMEELAVDGAARPLLITDKTLWRRIVFEWPGTIGVQYMHETDVRYYGLKVDPGPHTFLLEPYGEDAGKKMAISYELVQPDVLALDGEIDGKKIRARLRRMDDSRFPLISRGFHWINEWPLNR
ncbi:MAG TPA: hypothetical protein VN493_29275 [Thermoanaerobaculia bacterium]|nr:hypothetical protein [Thermoanaerobaculia bacterium]